MPLAPTEADLANHLAKLASEGRSAAMLCVRRSAVRKTIRQVGGVAPPVDGLVADVVRGHRLRLARTPRRVPAWDLFMVLAFLRGHPFEPLRRASLRLLTWKIAFLLALALGRRSSEIANLSGLSADIAREGDGSWSLHFLPEFLAKNQQPGDPSPILFVRPMSDIVAPDELDALNCPARALRIYRSRTRSLRAPTQRALLISVNPDRNRDVAKTTVARWISMVIRAAYENLGEQEKGGGRPRASSSCFCEGARGQSVGYLIGSIKVHVSVRPLIGSLLAVP